MWPTEATSSSTVSSTVSRSPYRETTHPVAITTRNRFTLNSLWSCWYGVLIVILQIYIIGKCVNRFTGDHGLMSLSWPKNSTPYTELNAYVILIGAGVILLPFFAISAIMKIGNTSNDGIKIGSKVTSSRQHVNRANHSLRNINYNATFQGNDDQSTECIYANYTRSTNTHVSSSKQSLLMKLWQHMLPIAPLIHVLSAFSFLLPRVLMESQLIAHNFLPKSDLWKTEMDCFLDFIQDGRVELLDFLQPINETEKAWLKQTLAENSQLSVSRTQIVSTNSDSSFIVHTTRSSIAQKLDLTPGLMSLEFINLIIALLIILVRYPCIFWRINKIFALLMSFQLFITSLVTLIIYSSFCILYKVHIMTPDRAFLRYPSAFILTARQTVILTITFILLLLLSSSTLCMYGCSKFNQWKRKQLSKSYITHKSSTTNSIQSTTCCWGFAPHLLAFLCLIVKSMVAIPLMYDFIVVYCGSLDSASLVGAFAIAFYLLEYIILWLFLTVKHSWTFKILSLVDEQVSRVNRAPALLPGDKFTSSKKPAQLLVIDHGKTYQIHESACRAAIRSLASKANNTSQSLSPVDPINSSETTQQFWLPSEHDSKVRDECERNQKSDVCDDSNSIIQSDKNINSSPDDLEDADDKNTRPFNWLRSASRRSSMSSSKKKHSSLKDATGISEIESFLNQPSDNMSSQLQSVPEKRVFLSNGDGTIEQQSSIHHHRYPSMNGDYELLVESNNQNQSTTGDHSMDYDIYGVRRLFSQGPFSTLNRKSERYSSSNHQVMQVNSFNQQNSRSNVTSGVIQSNFHPRLDRFTRVGSISSESSTSPEKLSETSSGIHSDCPSITSEKRCSSAENLSMITGNFINRISNNTGSAYIHSRPSFRTSSLQRAAIQVRCPKVTKPVQTSFTSNTLDTPLPPPMVDFNTIGLRRMKQQQQTTQSSEVSCRHASLASDLSDLDSLMNQPLPPPPPETLTSVALLESSATANSCNYSHSSVKPIVSIAPQLPMNTVGTSNCYTFASQPAMATFTCPPVDTTITQTHVPSEFELALQKHFM